jgi:hypothetical protein
MRPWWLRPPCLRRPTVSCLMGGPFQRCERSTMRRKRKPGVVGRYCFIASTYARPLRHRCTHTHERAHAHMRRRRGRASVVAYRVLPPSSGRTTAATSPDQAPAAPCVCIYMSASPRARTRARPLGHAPARRRRAASMLEARVQCMHDDPAHAAHADAGVFACAVDGLGGAGPRVANGRWCTLAQRARHGTEEPAEVLAGTHGAHGPRL